MRLIDSSLTDQELAALAGHARKARPSAIKRRQFADLASTYRFQFHENGRQHDFETQLRNATVEPGQKASETQKRTAGLTSSFENGRQFRRETQCTGATVEPGQSHRETHEERAGLTNSINRKQSPSGRCDRRARPDAK